MHNVRADEEEASSRDRADNAGRLTTPMTDFQKPNVTFERERGVYAIQVTPDVAHTIIDFGETSDRSAFISRVLRTLADATIPIFLVKIHRSAVTLALVGTDVEAAEAALKTAGFPMDTRRDLALVVVRAASMRDMAGVMVAISDSLTAANARLFETGDSHNSVQCLIEADLAAAAAAELCRTFHLDPATAIHEVTLGGDYGA